MLSYNTRDRKSTKIKCYQAKSLNETALNYIYFMVKWDL